MFLSPCPASSLTGSSLCLRLSESRDILFISRLSPVFSISPLSSFSPALLAVCSKYTEAPPESRSEVCMGWNRKERVHKERRERAREGKGMKIRACRLTWISDFKLLTPLDPLFVLFPQYPFPAITNVTAVALYNACTLSPPSLMAIMSFITKCQNLPFATSVHRSSIAPTLVIVMLNTSLEKKSAVQQHFSGCVGVTKRGNDDDLQWHLKHRAFTFESSIPKTY